MSETEPWQWTEQTWRTHVERVRAGRTLAPPWPDGARVAVALSFDADHETIPLRDAETRPGRLSQGQYGSRVGTPRVLDLLERHRAPASFFVPAVSALLHPEEVRDVARAGHEVAAHGWIHERNALLARKDERELLHRSLDALEELTGTRPTGMRTPSWDFSDATLDLALDAGLAYDSSLMADDECYELVQDGRATGMVEIPVEWIRDDAPYFTMERFNAVRPHTPPRAVLGMWRDEFDAAREAGGLFQLTMHPHVIGHRSRLVVLAELLDHITAHDDVWLATHAQVAQHVATALAPEHEGAPA
ncbi:polysaccharide deacetylase [uncultured Pseudokineococcus sp.]|uniref:polysaccharide deacetylase family protein n=1 Tax=uncultured Pseudokineococcus sp. TaxID=1642928 RepID=UPI00263425CC|nr:polysaccharide deacetylase [uncultured Pseudokineococcus sp.]